MSPYVRPLFVLLTTWLAAACSEPQFKTLDDTSDDRGDGAVADASSGFVDGDMAGDGSVIDASSADASVHGGSDSAAPDGSTALLPPGPGADDIIDLALGFTHSCALFGSGRMLCWGSNEFGELGRDEDSGCTTGKQSHCPPGEPVGVTEAIDIAAGDHFTCAVQRDHVVRCWGLNTYGQAGAPEEQAWVYPNTVLTTKGLPLSSVDEVVAGERHACARAGSQVYCWGDNQSLQLAVIDVPGGPYAYRVDALDPRLLAAGHRFSCALDGLGTQCWGDNSMGQLAQAEGIDAHAVVRVSELPAQGLAAGEEHLCLLVDGEVWCAGAASMGRLGVGDITPLELPECATEELGGVPCTDTFHRAKLAVPVLSVAAGRYHTCAGLDDEDRGVACWGAWAAAGEAWGSKLEPAKMAHLRDVRIVAAGAEHSCAADGSGLWCWGSNGSAQLGVPASGGSPEPQRVLLVAP